MTKKHTDPKVTPINRHPDELVERLLHLADKGPEIPELGREQVRAALRPLWQQQVHRPRPWMWLAGLAAAMVVAVVLAQRMTVNSTTTGPVATCITFVGEVEIEDASNLFQTLGLTDEGTSIEAGAWLRTDENSLTALALTGGHTLRLDSNTHLRVDGESRVFLQSGAVYVTNESATGGPIEVHTPMGFARDVGTRFEVRVGDEQMQVSVREGLVEIDRDDMKIQVSEGRALRIDSDGSTDIRAIRPDSEEWAWTMRVAPPFDPEGKTVAAFLQWAAAETGLEVRYSDDHTAQFATTTYLHGRFANLSPAEAPAFVLPSTGLELEMTNGTMIVSIAR